MPPAGDARPGNADEPLHHPACLPEHDLVTGHDTYMGLRCVATGWGQTTHDGGLESRLHQVVLRVVNNTDCDTMYQLRYGVDINDGHVCAGPEPGSVTGTCVGDSGGPLQCNLKVDLYLKHLLCRQKMMRLPAKLILLWFT